MAENIMYSKGEPLQERTFTVELTEDTFTRFIEMVYRDGTTPAEVLEGFINDLVCGSHTRGSDERMYASQYYKRCMYGDFDPLTFCRFILRDYGSIDVIRDSLEKKQDAAADLAYYTEHLDEDPDGKEAAFMRSIIQEADEEIKELYQEYTDTAGTDAEPMDEALKGVSVFLEALKGGK